MSSDAPTLRNLEQLRTLLIDHGFRTVAIDAAAHAQAPRQGMLGRHRVVGHLGAGGMGEVLLVRDADLERNLAAKVLHNGAGADPRQLAKFLREAQITGQLEHPNIVPIHEVGLTDAGALYFTMKVVDGRTFGEEIAAAPTSSRALAQLLGNFLRVCEAVGFAHSKGVLHRDLKPSNVMIGRFGEVQVMDWGLARVMDAPDDLADAVAPAADSGTIRERLEIDEPPRTLDGTVMGTPAYMPPEQARGAISEMDARADVYSLGAILYHLLTGVPPYEHSTAYAVLAAVLEGPPPPPSERAGRRVPWELEAVVARAMAPDPDDRYADVGDLRADIAAYLAGQPLAAARYTRLQRLAKWIGRHRAIALTATIVAALAAAAAVGARSKSRWRETTTLRLRIDTLRERADAARVRVRALADDDAEPLREHNGAPRREAVARWHARHRAALRWLDELARLEDRARALGISGVDWQTLAAERRTLALAASRKAAAFDDIALAQLWLARARDAGLAPADVADERRRIAAAARANADAAIAAVRTALDRIVQLAGTRHVGSGAVDHLLPQITRHNRPEVVRLLLAPENIDSANEWRRRLTVAALGRLGDTRTPGPDGKDTVLSLANRLYDSRDASSAREIIRALGLIGDPRVLDLLQDAQQRLAHGSALWTDLDRAMNRLRMEHHTLPDDQLPPRVLAGKANHLADNGRHTEALALLEKALARAPDDGWILCDRGSVLVALGRRAEGIRDFRRALELDPKLMLAYANLGQQLVILRKLDEAAALYDRALAIEARNIPVLQARASLRLSTGKYEAGLADIDAVLAQAPDSPSALCLRAHLRDATGDVEGAMADATQALRVAPDHPEGWLTRALLRSRHRGLRHDALKDADRAVSLSPSYARALRVRADVHRQLGALDKAIADYTSALALAPHDIHVLEGRGSVHYSRRDYPAAIRDFEAAARVDPASTKAVAMLIASRFEATRDRERAFAELDVALKRLPRSSRLHSLRANLLLDAGRPREAIASATRALECKADNTEALGTRGVSYQRTKQYALAEADFTALIRLEPSGLAYYNRGIVRELQKKTTEAERDYGSAIDRGYRYAYRPRAELRLRRRDHTGATADFEAACRFAPRDWRSLHGLAACLQRSDTPRALALLERALTLAPPSYRERILAQIRQLRDR